MRKLIDLAGKNFGHWTVESHAGLAGALGHKVSTWNCVCSCGNRRVVLGKSLREGRSQSCGCRWRSKDGQRRYFDTGQPSSRRRFHNYRSSAKNRGLQFELCWEDFRSLIESPCYYCGEPPTRAYAGNGRTAMAPGNGIDRYMNGEGYTEANSVPCCTRCNYMKSNTDGPEFIALIITIADRLSRMREVA
jgi:hypothetical protein